MNRLIRNTLGLLLVVGSIAGTTSVTLARAPIDWAPGDVIELEGYTRFGVCSIGEHRVLLDPIRSLILRHLAHFERKKRIT